MKKYILIILIIIIFPSPSYSGLSFSQKENKLLNGPVMENIKTYISSKDSVLIFKADIISFEKQKLGFFKTSLIKKLTAQNIYVELKKNNNTKLLFTAEKSVFSGNAKKTSIKNPRIVYPKNIKNPEKILIIFNEKIDLIYNDKKISFKF